MSTFAGVEVTHEEVRTTLVLLRWYRAFIDSGMAMARDPAERRSLQRFLTREQASERLVRLLHQAINRKGCVTFERKADYDVQVRFERDQRALEDIRTRRLRVYQFETRAVRERFSHLLASREDD